MNLFKKVIQEMAEYNAEDEYSQYSKKLVDKYMKTKKYANEYEVLKKIIKHLKLDYNAKKTLEKSISELKIKDQLQVCETLDELLEKYNRQTYKALGTLLGEYIREYAYKQKDYDVELYTELMDSSLLGKEEKVKLESSIKELTKKSSKLSTNHIKIMMQQRLYDALFAERKDILAGKMRMGIVFKKYLDDSITRVTLIDKYLLHRLIDLIYGGLTEEEIEDEQ